MKGKSALVALAAFLLLATFAQAQPSPPNQFFGSVNINGALAPDGVLVEARISGQFVAGTTTSGGGYGYAPDIFYVPDPQGNREGKIIEFYVQNVKAGQAVFHTGESVRLDLSASISGFCGDAKCDSGESCSSCSGDCGACPPGGGGGTGGGGGSSGGTTVASNASSAQCQESWICTDWTECSNSVQKRVCADVNRCGTTANKPTEQQDCVMPVVCQAGEKVCTGNKLMVCSALGTTWIEEKTCEQGCSNGACGEDVAASGPAVQAGIPLAGFFLLEPSAWPYWIVIIVIVAILLWYLLTGRKKAKKEK